MARITARIILRFLIVMRLRPPFCSVQQDANNR